MKISNIRTPKPITLSSNKQLIQAFTLRFWAKSKILVFDWCEVTFAQTSDGGPSKFDKKFEEDPENHLKCPFSTQFGPICWNRLSCWDILVCDPKGQVCGEPLRPRCYGNWSCCHWTLPQVFGMNTQDTRSQKHSWTYWTGSSVAFTHSSGRSLFWKTDGKQPYLPRKRTHSSPDVSGDTLSWRDQQNAFAIKHTILTLQLYE